MGQHETKTSKYTKAGYGLPSSSIGAGGLVFPSNLRAPDYADRPVISFTCRYKLEAETPISIFLPCPSGISISDGASYNTIDIGTVSAGLNAAAAVVGAVKGVMGGGSVKGAIGGLKDKVVANSSFSEVARMAAGAMPGGGLGALADFGAQQVTNPRTNTAFTGNTIRTFGFTFKLVANSAAESITAKDIHNTFRQMVYAKEVTALSLSYPPLWTVRFMSGDKGVKKENPFIPRMHMCYLTAVSSTFNSTSNTWRKDQAPLEIDVALQFQEMKILSQDDIIGLEADPPKRDIGNAVRKAVTVLKREASKAKDKAVAIATSRSGGTKSVDGNGVPDLNQ